VFAVPIGTSFRESVYQAMPRYFYSSSHGSEQFSDTEGVILRDDQEAWEEATVACAEILKDADGNLLPGVELRLDVKDEDGEPLYRLRVVPELLKLKRQTMSNGQGIIRDEKGQEQPTDKVRARKAAKTEPGHMPSQRVIQEKPVGKDEG
jgi:hypothetical protein